MWQNLIGTSSTNMMERAMDAANLRQQLLTQNLANANTPNYKRVDLDFKNVFATEIDKNELSMQQTNPRHYGNTTPETGPLQVTRETKTDERYDQNNVDVEFESSQLAENSLYFQAVATSWKKEMTVLKQAIEGR